jgi:hypothetical protein
LTGLGIHIDWYRTSFPQGLSGVVQLSTRVLFTALGVACTQVSLSVGEWKRKAYKKTQFKHFNSYDAATLSITESTVKQRCGEVALVILPPLDLLGHFPRLP